MQTTTNYGLKIYEGTDLFNPLTVENINTSDLDTIVKGVSDAAVGTATELLTGTVHALTRADTDRDIFHFTATADFEAGETFEVDGVQVTAKTPDGQNLSTGAYVINSSVLCILDGTLLTVVVNPAKALDSDKLDGHDSTYFATAGDLTVLDNQVGAISSKVGTGVLTTTAQDCIGAINEVNADLSQISTHLSNIKITPFVQVDTAVAMLLMSSPNAGLDFTVPAGKWIIFGSIPYTNNSGNQFVTLGPIDMCVQSAQTITGFAMVNLNTSTAYHCGAQTTAFTASRGVRVYGIRID